VTRRQTSEGKRLCVAGQQGFSLVSVLVAVSLLAVVAMLTSKSMRSLSRASKNIESSAAAKDVESALVQAIITKLQDYIASRSPSLTYS